jgi:hypothetical protein
LIIATIHFLGLFIRKEETIKMTIKNIAFILLLITTTTTTAVGVGDIGKCYFVGIPSVIMLGEHENHAIFMTNAYVNLDENTTQMTMFNCKITDDFDDKTFVVAYEQDFQQKVQNKWIFCVYNWFNCSETFSDSNNFDDVSIQMTVLLRQSVAIVCFTLYMAYATTMIVAILRSKPKQQQAPPQTKPEADSDSDSESENEEQSKAPPTTPIDNENHDINLIQRVKQDDSIKVVESNEEV